MQGIAHDYQFSIQALRLLPERFRMISDNKRRIRHFISKESIFFENRVPIKKTSIIPKM